MKLLFLPLLLVAVYLVLIVPLLLTLIVLAPWLMFVLMLLSLPFAHAYLYSLYRELLA